MATVVDRATARARGLLMDHGYRRYSQDGTAHFAYFMDDTLLSFVWDGCAGHPVEVEHGGYGEPVLALCLIDEGDLPHDARLSPAGWALWFERFCNDLRVLLLPLLKEVTDD